MNAAQRFPLVRVRAGQEECVRRMYILHLPLNDDDLPDRHQKNVTIVEAAVLYPHGQKTVMSVPSYQILEVSDSDPLSTDEGKYFIRVPEKE